MTPRRRGRGLAAATAVLALGIAAPAASAATGVYKGSGTDAAGDARADHDIVRAEVAYGQATGTLRTTVGLSAKPSGDVDVQLGRRQASGACGLPFVTLTANAATGTGAWKGSGGRAKKAAKVTYAGGTLTASVTDPELEGRTPDCAMAMVYGGGTARSLRDTLDVFAVSDGPAAPTTPTTPGGGDGGTPPTGDGAGDTDGDGIPDDFDGDGLPDDLDGDGIPDALTGDGTGETGDDGGAAPGPDLSVRVYGIPRRLKRGRSYEARIRIRNDGEADATRLRVRLTRRAGVALSRRVASVSRVRSGKGITVHVRVRLTSRRTTRTIRVSVSGADATARTTLRLRRRAGD